MRRRARGPHALRAEDTKSERSSDGQRNQQQDQVGSGVIGSLTFGVSLGALALAGVAQLTRCATPWTRVIPADEGVEFEQGER